jgi:hypothetical protein
MYIRVFACGLPIGTAADAVIISVISKLHEPTDVSVGPK